MSAFLMRILEFTVLPKLINKLTDRWFGDKIEPATPTTAVVNNSKEQELLSKSPRKGSLRIPEGLEPSISVVKYDIRGKIEFTSASLPVNKKVPSGYGFDVITSNGNHTDDHLGGYHYQDSRWNKHYGDNLKQFMVVLFHDKEGIKEYSRVYEV